MKKVLAMILVVGLLAFTVSGCGFLQKAKDIKDGLDDIGDVIEDIEDDIEDDIDDNDDDTDSVVDDPIYYPADFKELLAKYQEFGYKWNAVGEDGTTNNWSIHYLFEGTEEIDGVPTEIFTVTMVEYDETTVQKYWFNQDGECIKARADEQDIEVYSSAGFTMLTQLYVNYVYLTQGVLADDGTVDTFAYTLEDERSESSDLGDMDVYEFSSHFSPVIFTYGLMEIDGDLTFVYIKQTIPDSPVMEEMTVTHMVTR